MAILNPPPANSVDAQDASGMLLEPRDGWRNFFQSVYNACLSITSNGTTAQRPVKMLWIGRRFFDTSLGIPIWYNGTDWVDATGAVV